MISSSPQSLSTRSGSARLQPVGQVAQQPGDIRGLHLQGLAVPAQGQAVARAQGDEGVPGEAQGQGGEGRRGELQGKGLLQGLEPQQAPALGLQPIPGAGKEAAGIKVVGGHVQVAVVALHPRGQRPQPIPQPVEQAVGPDLQGQHRHLLPGPQVPAPGRIGSGAPSPGFAGCGRWRASRAGGPPR